MASPAISVIIPLYNAEKYLSDCLDSLLAQTFSDFEIIVVDDCSTDNSVAIVESYAPKFNGRLILTATKKNSGNAGYTARNKGFLFSRGEYVFFMDADDMITNNALETFYTVAKDYKADVVYTGSRYLYTSEENIKINFDGIAWRAQEKKIEEKPTLTINDPHKNLQELLITGGLFWTPWTKFVWRDFLTKNDISFYEAISGSDHLWTLELLLCSERLLRIPNALYFWRNDSSDSMTRKKRPVDEQISTWSKAFVSFAQAVTKISNKQALLKEHPDYCYMALRNHFNYFFERSIEARFQVSSEKVYKILQRESENKTELDSIVPFFFSMIDAQQKNLLINQQQSTQYVEYTQERITKLERQDKIHQTYIAELENFIAQSQQRIGELENEVKRLKG